jgi:hypothetical protein
MSAPQLPKKGIVNPADVELAAMLEKSRQQWQQFRRDMIGQVARNNAGTWMHPPELAGWSFFRCGRRPQKGKSSELEVAQVEAIYASMKSMGFIDAPPTVAFHTGSGIESAEVGLFVMAPREVADEYTAWKAEKKKEHVRGQQAGSLHDAVQHVSQKFPGVVDFDFVQSTEQRVIDPG